MFTNTTFQHFILTRIRNIRMLSPHFWPGCFIHLKILRRQEKLKVTGNERRGCTRKWKENENIEIQLWTAREICKSWNLVASRLFLIIWFRHVWDSKFQVFGWKYVCEGESAAHVDELVAPGKWNSEDSKDQKRSEITFQKNEILIKISSSKTWAQRGKMYLEIFFHFPFAFLIPKCSCLLLVYFAVLVCGWRGEIENRSLWEREHFSTFFSLVFPLLVIIKISASSYQT